MEEPFELTRLERAVVPEAVTTEEAHAVEDMAETSEGAEEEVVDMAVTGGMGTGAMDRSVATGAVTGATEAVVTEAAAAVAATLVAAAATETAGVGAAMESDQGDRTEMAMTAMLHTSKNLPDSRPSLGWLYVKDARLKKCPCVCC